MTPATEFELEFPSSRPELRLFDETLKCNICYELYTGPVTLACGHSFCSQCVRQNFDYKIRAGIKTACPQCRAPCDPGDLRPSHDLRAAAETYQRVKALLVKACHMAEQPKAPPEPSPPPEAAPAAANQSDAQAVFSRRMSLRTSSRAPAVQTSRRSSTTQQDQQQWQQQQQEQQQEQQEGSEPSAESTSNSDSDFEISEEAQQGPPAKRRRTSAAHAVAQQQQTAAHAVAQQQQTAAHAVAQQQHTAAAADEEEEEAVGPSRAASPAAAPAPSLAAKGAAAQLPDGLVGCPVCGMTIKEGHVNIHLDQCLSRAAPAAPAPAATLRSIKQPARAAPAARPAPAPRPAAAAASKGSRPGSKAPPAELEAPPKLCFAIMKDQDLKKKMQQIGLPLDGKRAEWIDRYSKFRSYVLAAKDQHRATTLAVLLAEFKKEERKISAAKASGGRQAAVGMVAELPDVTNSDVAVKVGSGSFKDLISATRQRMQALKENQQQGQRRQQQQQGEGEGRGGGEAAAAAGADQQGVAEYEQQQGIEQAAAAGAAAGAAAAGAAAGAAGCMHAEQLDLTGDGDEQQEAQLGHQQAQLHAAQQLQAAPPALAEPSQQAALPAVAQPLWQQRCSSSPAAAAAAALPASSCEVLEVIPDSEEELELEVPGYVVA